MNAEGSFLDDNLLSSSAPDPSVIEVASEVREDSSSEQSMASSFKRQDLVCDSLNTKMKYQWF